MITKYKIFENKLENIKIDVLTSDQFKDLYFKIYPEQINLNSLIKYFSWDTIGNYYGNKKHNDSIRLITAYNEDILGICFFAWWEFTNSYSISYLSTNKNYFGMGISKKLLEKTFEYFHNEYPNEVLNFSGYSIDGWLYLRKNIIYLSKKYNVKIKEKAIEYVTDWNDEKRELFNKSKEEIKKTYGVDEAKSRGKDIIYNFRTKAISNPDKKYDVVILAEKPGLMFDKGYKYILSIEGTPGAWYVKTLLQGETINKNRFSIQGYDWYCDNWKEIMDELIEILPNLDSMADVKKYNL